MLAFTLTVLIFAASFGAIALLALGWAISSGQYADFRAGARSIFDEEEPIGQPTDAFPDDDRIGR